MNKRHTDAQSGVPGSILYIIGCGPGSKDYLTLKAMEVVRKTDVIIGPRKLADLFAPLSGHFIPAEKKISEIMDRIQEHLGKKSICVLVSGDPGCYSLARLIVDRFGLINCRLVPGISSVQLALSRLGLDWTEARVLSVHGRKNKPGAEQILSLGLCVILLGGDLVWMGSLLNRLLKKRWLVLMQDLGLPEENISTIKSASDLKQEISQSSLLVISQHPHQTMETR